MHTLHIHKIRPFIIGIHKYFPKAYLFGRISDENCRCERLLSLVLGYVSWAFGIQYLVARIQKNQHSDKLFLAFWILRILTFSILNFIWSFKTPLERQDWGLIYLQEVWELFIWREFESFQMLSPNSNSKFSSMAHRLENYENYNFNNLKG